MCSIDSELRAVKAKKRTTVGTGQGTNVIPPCRLVSTGLQKSALGCNPRADRANVFDSEELQGDPLSRTLAQAENAVVLAGGRRRNTSPAAHSHCHQTATRARQVHKASSEKIG